MKGLGAVLIACILVVGHVNAAQGASSPSGSSNWASVSYSSLPSAVKAAALKKAASVTPITQEVPLATDNPVSIYHDDLLRKEAGGTTYWQLPVFVTSKSLASKCPYPFLTETINVNVSKSSSGKVTANKATLGRVQMTTGMENPNITAAVKCIGDNDWKRAHSRAENFLKGLHTQG